MEEIKVSVIVPVYNAEKILSRNISILIMQRLKEIEYIFVNDASTDRSLDILQNFRDKYGDKIIIIDSDRNRGPGGARNLGIAKARGKYIGFMDQDDVILEEMYEEMYAEATRGDYDIVSCGYYNKYDEQYWPPLRIKGKISAKEKIKLTNYVLYIWNRIYKRELIDRMSMLFRENVVNDDVDFCIEAFLRAKSVSYADKMFYYYNYDGSTLSRPEKVNYCRYLHQTDELFLTLERRIEDTEMWLYKKKICRNLVLIYGKGILLAMFSKPNFSYEDYIYYTEIVSRLAPNYFLLKSDQKDLSSVLFNMPEEDKRTTYEKLIDLKRSLTTTDKL